MPLKSNISKPIDRAVIGTILGDAGVGKTTLACTFPKPIVMRAEDGLQAIPLSERPDAFDEITSVDDVWSQLKDLMNEDHDYKTLVVDSVTALERLFIQHVIDSDSNNPRSINQAMGGYGAGLSAVSTMHHRVRKGCGLLNKNKGMNIIFVAHADTEIIELPDCDAYTRYNLRLSKKSQAPYTDDSDFVGFVRLKTYVKGDKDNKNAVKKAISDGTRVIDCTANAASVSKNRYSITKMIPVEKGVNPFLNIIPSINNEAK